jgi:FKBP-type peptidyl-prolyl cis-trans isomerase
VDDKSSTPVTMNFFNLIEGVRTALPLFPVGSKGRIFIPSYYGYGSSVNGNVPANSNLIFEVSLLGVTDYHLKNDTVTINKYIATNKLKAFTDPSGIRYSIDSLGSSATVPQVTDSVTTKYTVKLFDGTVVQTQSSPVKFLLSDLILAWKILLPSIPEGSAVTFYTPSSYAYGPNSSSSGISPNTNLIFHVNLVKVSHH